MKTGAEVGIVIKQRMIEGDGGGDGMKRRMEGEGNGVVLDEFAVGLH
jgi:hypothetical protein